jgi:multiple sugar transport system substrate-binding protein/lactose/L-arabinose transport system substrate-binding protein
MSYALGREESQLTMYREYGLFPALETTYDSEAYDQPNEFLGGQEAGRIYAEIAPNIEPYRYTVDTPEVTQAINTHFRDMMAGDKTPKEAVDAAAQQVVDRTDRDLA